MITCFFVSDLHGRKSRYDKLFAAIADDKPPAVFLGGDLLPSGTASFTSDDSSHGDFVNNFLLPTFSRLRRQLDDEYPHVFLILGNDDSRLYEAAFIDAQTHKLWEYVHNRKVLFDGFVVYGYGYVPPTPFMLKDWERYDISRYVDPGCVSPEEGYRSVAVSEHERKYTTIEKDLRLLVGDDNLEQSIFLFHTPPHDTKLDCIASHGKMVDYVPMETHVGSIAVRRLIETRQPLVTLHGHIHESARLTGFWQERIGRTYAFSAAHDGPELALVRFDPRNPAEATRDLL